MSAAVETIEGWYALHDFRSINWNSWKYISNEERNKFLNEWQSMTAIWQTTEDQKHGSTAIYSILGQKADFVIIHLRETLEELQELETEFNKSAFADHTIPTYSYVSIVELSAYMVNPGTDPMESPEIVARLYPIMPKSKHVCFYPMNKKREGNDNWYMLGMDERREMIASHGRIGRGYAGRVKQIITGSVGFDDWEWGVTLFADDALEFKKLVYEMRFDEASARFAEFGEFYVGNLLTNETMNSMLQV